jgi:hypothetical protein
MMVIDRIGKVYDYMIVYDVSVPLFRLSFQWVSVVFDVFVKYIIYMISVMSS